MWLNDPRINNFCDKLRHRFDGTRVEELVRISYQFAYASGFNDGLFADPDDDMAKLLKQAKLKKDSASIAERYFPETKTCPKCGHRWGGV